MMQIRELCQVRRVFLWAGKGGSEPKTLVYHPKWAARFAHTQSVNIDISSTFYLKTFRKSARHGGDREKNATNPNQEDIAAQRTNSFFLSFIAVRDFLQFWHYVVSKLMFSHEFSLELEICYLKIDVSCEVSVNFHHISQNATPATLSPLDAALPMRFAKKYMRPRDGRVQSDAPATNTATLLLKNRKRIGRT